MPRSGAPSKSPIALATELAQALRDVLHDINQDDPGDHEDHNAPRLAEAERLAQSVVSRLRDLK
jgi:hypothetical protein